MDCTDMLGGHGAMMWAMGGLSLLVVALLLLGVAALARYLLFGRGGRVAVVPVGGPAGHGARP